MNFKRRHTREPICPDTNSPAAGRLKIGFVGMSAGAGATTLAFAAAEYIAARLPGRAVTLLELDMRASAPAGRPYDKVGIDRRFAGRDYISFFRLAAEGRPLGGAVNMDGGINWALRVPGEHGPAPCAATLHRLLNNVSGDIIICDISPHEHLSGMLADLSCIICIFDPLPSRLLASVPAAEACRAAAAAGIPATWVFNKLNAGVNLREATRFTGISNYIPIPAIPAETVYAAEYACRSLAAELTQSLATLFK